MKNELISVETEDGIILHGALYEAPAAKEIAVIIQHGAAMNFIPVWDGFYLPYCWGGAIAA